MSGIHDGGLNTRVRAALRSRADQVSLGPGAVGAAWEQTVTRNGRAGGRAPGGYPGRKARRWAAPLAAAASVAVIGAGIGVVSSFHSADPEQSRCSRRTARPWSPAASG